MAPANLPKHGQLDLTGLLLEGGDDLPEPVVLLGVVPVVYHTTRSAARCAERRYYEQRGEDGSLAAHVVTSLISRTATISSLPMLVRPTEQVRGSAKAALGSLPAC
jgi:hypothetical protein